MTTISVRISKKEKAALKKHGKISRVVKEAITVYLGSERSRKALRRLRELQRDGNVKTTTKEQVALIREDRRKTD